MGIVECIDDQKDAQKAIANSFRAVLSGRRNHFDVLHVVVGGFDRPLRKWVKNLREKMVKRRALAIRPDEPVRKSRNVSVP
ncbi:MAG TPA: hypothetical protein VG963_24355 [Polyangiaceae bacterium]|nr:hypothetical protein [Polyangiaceae bacterium]